MDAELKERIFRTAADGSAQGVWSVPPSISDVEMAAARLAPRCIVENYLYADVGTLNAPGSTGKTTATLFEAVCIVLGLPVWGMRVETPGPVLIVTAEDRREFLVARLREICKGMRLSPAQTQLVRAMVRIDDRTVNRQRLTAIVGDVVEVAAFANDIVSGCRANDFAPVLIQFDPLVSFGVGEARVNDAEQGVIDAARVIVGGLDCCVRLVHHVGKAGARERSTDQYAGRGGSSLADGCRMVHVMQPADASELLRATGRGLAADENAFSLHRPKLTYAPPQRDRPLYVIRRGFQFEHVSVLDSGGREAAAEQREVERQRELRGAVLDAVDAAWRQGLPLTQRALVDKVRARAADVRDVVGQLLAEAWLYEVKVPAGWRLTNNSRRTYIVRLTLDERDSYRQTGELPADKMTPPPSVALPPERTT
jgi:RecA-family ATPase